MWRSLSISHQDWRQTPSAVQTTLISLAHQAHSPRIRCLAYQQQMAPLRQASAQLKDLKAQIARSEEEIATLRRQVIYVEDLKVEIAELKARLGQNVLKMTAFTDDYAQPWPTGTRRMCSFPRAPCCARQVSEIKTIRPKGRGSRV